MARSKNPLKIAAVTDRRVQVTFSDGVTVQVRQRTNGTIEVCTPGHQLERMGMSGLSVMRIRQGRRRSIMDYAKKES